MTPRAGCYPGTFNPPTVAHVAVAEAAVRQAGLDRLDLVLARVTLGKETLAMPSVDERRRVLEAVASTRPWLGVVITDARLIAEMAAGYAAVVMGADKWAQVNDPAWYGGSAVARDAAVAGLPRVLVAPRAGEHPEGVELLDLPAHLHDVSATAVRAGHDHARTWLLPEAEASGLWP
jgi:nicotinic acid mononucleotide adenylyltransferase